MYRCISPYPFITVFPCCYLALSFYNCTCWVPIISILNLAIIPYYSNLLLRRRGWTRILQRGVLGYVFFRLSFLWCYGVFCYSVPLSIIIVFRDTIYVIIIILYSGHLDICGHFWPYVWNNWSWVMHTMCTWFWHKNLVWQKGSMSLWLGAQQYRWAIFSISINVHGGRATRGARSMLWLLTGSTRGLIVHWLPLCCISQS
jgi:hypothetical protein